MKKELVLKEAESLKEELVEIRRTLHQMPETGFDLNETMQYVRKKLLEYGCEPVECGKAGLTVLLGKKEGKTFLLRADMDALPMKEEADVAFASVNGKMHACGHDLHTAMLLGAAKILKAHEDEIEGRIKLMFQSAEEIFEGAQDMIDHGVLEKPKPDAAMMIHVMAGLKMPAGMIRISDPGVGTPAADLFRIEIQGKGCHGSMPNTGVDPLIPMAHLLVGIQELQTRELAVSERAVLTVGSVHAGTAPNIIPDSVTMTGSLRTFDEDVRARLKQRLIEISKSMCQAYRCDAEVVFTSGCPTLMNDEELCNDVYESLSELLKQNVLYPYLTEKSGTSKSSGSGSEDFAYVSQRVPSVMLALAAGTPEEGHPYPQHHPKVTFDESVLPIGTAVFVHCAVSWLNKHKG